MYENGGNTTHRTLDGHPELFVYPFESQVGTGFNNDFLSSYVPLRYRWPEFPMYGSPEQDYEMFWDEELKTLMRVPDRSKFRHAGLQIGEADRKQKFVELLRDKPRTRGNIVEAFFRSTFDAWKNYNRTGREKAYVGYNPVQCLDAEKIFQDFPEATVLHVVRNPYSGFADTSKRPFPLSLSRYAWTWNYCQMVALTYAERYPRNFFIMRFEDLVGDTRATMTKVCQQLQISFSETCLYPSFNGEKLVEVFPWGTIRLPTPEANLATANELTAAQKKEMRSLTGVMMKPFGYDSFL
jgi:hypothetical protein